METVNCLGSCALGPLVTVDGKYYGKVGTAQMDKILDGYQGGGEQTDEEAS